MHEDWLAKSVPIKLSSVMVGHAIHQDRDEVSFFNLLDNFNFGLNLSVIYLLSLIAILVISFFINLTSHRIRFGRRRTGKISKEIVSTLGSFRRNRLPAAMDIFILFVNLFFWLSQLFLTNNVKTNKVVVDTSHLIKTAEDISETTKVACIFKNGLLYKRISSSPTKSILGTIFEKTRLRPEMKDEQEIFGERCLLTFDSKMLKTVISKNVFMVGEQDAAHLIWLASYLARGLFNKVVHSYRFQVAISDGFLP